MAIVRLNSLSSRQIRVLEGVLPVPCWVSILGYENSGLVFPEGYLEGSMCVFKYDYSWLVEGDLVKSEYSFQVQPGRIWLNTRDVPPRGTWNPFEPIEKVGDYV